MSINHIVFYGTLMSSHKTSLDSTLNSSFTYISGCSFHGELHDGGRYPALAKGQRTIKGELYEILDKSALVILDKYEATDNDDDSLPGFSRKSIQLIEPRLVAWIYYYDGQLAADTLIAANRWNPNSSGV